MGGSRCSERVFCHGIASCLVSALGLRRELWCSKWFWHIQWWANLVGAIPIHCGKVRLLILKNQTKILPIYHRKFFSDISCSVGTSTYMHSASIDGLVIGAQGRLSYRLHMGSSAEVYVLTKAEDCQCFKSFNYRWYSDARLGMRTRGLKFLLSIIYLSLTHHYNNIYMWSVIGASTTLKCQ